MSKNTSQEPEYKDLCWFTDTTDFNNRVHSIAILAYFDKKYANEYYTIYGIHFKYCEKYTPGKFPSWFES
jgi:hypothetical protein